MSNDSSKPVVPEPAPEFAGATAPTQSAKQASKQRPNWWLLLGLPAWVLSSFVAAQLIVYLLLRGLQLTGLMPTVNAIIMNTTVAAVTYMITLALVIGLPWYLRKRRTSTGEMGLTRLPSWTDIGLAPVGYIVYLLATTVLIFASTTLIPGFSTDPTQVTGFEGISMRYEYVLAFITLVIIAPFAEEALFRGYLYGKLRRFAPVWLTILVTSLLFASLHLPGEQIQWAVGVDVFALSLVLCTLREVSGSIWAGVLLHMMKNGLAFYLLFINPALMSTIGG